MHRLAPLRATRRRGAVYLLVGVVGPFVTGTAANILALNTADHFLHIGSAIVLLVAGWVALRPGGQDAGGTSSDLRRAA
jgi:hypothetical protein